MLIGDDGWVAAEEDRIYDKNWNLIANAVSYKPETGDVRQGNILRSEIGEPSASGNLSEEDVTTTRYLTPLHVMPKT